MKHIDQTKRKYSRLGDEPINTPIRVVHSKGIIDRGYTDWMIFVGLTFKEAWEDYPTYAARYPEDFLGCNILIVPYDTDRQPARGRHITNWMMSERVYRHGDHRKVQRLMGELQYAKLRNKA